MGVKHRKCNKDGRFQAKNVQKVHQSMSFAFSPIACISQCCQRGWHANYRFTGFFSISVYFASPASSGAGCFFTQSSCPAP
jgi:hypothetical protein